MCDYCAMSPHHRACPMRFIRDHNRKIAYDLGALVAERESLIESFSLHRSVARLTQREAA